MWALFQILGKSALKQPEKSSTFMELLFFWRDTSNKYLIIEHEILLLATVN